MRNRTGMMCAALACLGLGCAGEPGDAFEDCAGTCDQSDVRGEQVLSGHVRLDNGRGADHALVVFQCAIGEELQLEQTEADRVGRYRVRNLANLAWCDVQVEYQGTMSSAVRINSGAEGARTVDMTLAESDDGWLLSSPADVGASDCEGDCEEVPRGQRISGFLRYQDGASVEGARVIFQCPNADGTQIGEATTSEDGRYLVPGLPELAECEVRVDHQGSLSEAVTVSSGRSGSKTADLILQQTDWGWDLSL